VCLFILLGGSASAALIITGKNIKNGSVTGADVKNNSIASRDVKNGNLLAKDFKAGQLPAGARGPRGDQGPKGDQGAKGDQGPAGTPDTSNFFTKAESDGRFAKGAARITPIPVANAANNGGAPVVAVPGVGNVDLNGCALGNMSLRYTNTSGGTQDWIVLGNYHAQNNLAADSGTVADGATFSTTNNQPRDIIHISVSGPHPAMFTLTTTRVAADNHCLVWGNVVSG
jgi:hypothetical protein